MKIWTTAGLAGLLAVSTACLGGDKEDDTATTDDSGVTDDTGDTGESGSELDLSQLTNPYGCASVNMGLYSADGHQGLIFYVNDNLPEQSWDAGGAPVTATYDLSSEAALVWQIGNQVIALHCNDALDGSERVDEEWTAISGDAELTVTTNEATDWDYSADATLTLTDIVLEDDSGNTATIGSLSWDATVGWLPG